MKCFQLPGLLLFMGYLFLISCDETQQESRTVSSGDPKAARIEGEVCLMNLSQDAKSRNLTIGKSNSFTKMGEVPAQAEQFYERTFILNPATSNPRLILVGTIRVEVCREVKHNSNHDSPARHSMDLNQDPGPKPQ